MTISISLTTWRATPSDPDNPKDVREAEAYNREQIERAARYEAIADKDQWTQTEALFILENIHSHSYVHPEMARRIAAPFGTPVRVERRINEGEGGLFTKGLYVESEPVGQTVEGVSAWLLAEAIARTVDPSYTSGLVGRGFRCRAAIEHIRAVLGEASNA